MSESGDERQPVGGPFEMGEEVVVYDDEDNEIDLGVVDGEREADGEWLYDVAGRFRRYDGISETFLDHDPIPAHEEC